VFVRTVGQEKSQPQQTQNGCKSLDVSPSGGSCFASKCTILVRDSWTDDFRNSELSIAVCADAVEQHVLQTRRDASYFVSVFELD